MLRLLVVSHTYSAAINHAKLAALARYAELSVIYPREWRDSLFTLRPTVQTRAYAQYPVPVRFNGRLFYHLYPPLTLLPLLEKIQPQVVYVEEEPHSLALAEFVALTSWHAYALVAFTWENLYQFYGLPGLHRYTLERCAGLIAGNRAAEGVLRRKGYPGPVQVTPQLGLDPEFFRPQRNSALRAELGLTQFTVGFIGRMVTEKGVGTLLQAAQALPNVQLLLIGGGPQLAELKAWATQHQLTARVRWVDSVSHEQIPAYLNALDVLVLPSRAARRWQEQFGHILIEAMACGVPVIGSNSGAIPEVIGDAGLIFPEDDAAALQAAIAQLRDQPTLRIHLAEAGRARVLAHYTHDQIARANIAFFQQVSGP